MRDYIRKVIIITITTITPTDTKLYTHFDITEYKVI